MHVVYVVSVVYVFEHAYGITITVFIVRVSYSIIMGLSLIGSLYHLDDCHPVFKLMLCMVCSCRLVKCLWVVGGLVVGVSLSHCA